jgi:hypothetical protein
MTSDEVAERLLDYATELEAQATALGDGGKVG